MEPSKKKLRTEELCTDVASNNGTNELGDTRPRKIWNSEDEDFFETLQNVEIIRVLNNYDEKCCVAVEAKLKGRSGKAVIVLQKLPFNEEKLSDIFSDQTSLRTLFKNDIYYNKVALIPPHINEVKTDIIYPAEDKHIFKYERQASSFVIETPELYKNVTLPYAQFSSNSKQWIYNILEHKKEADRIVCEDMDPETGFVLVPDMKWTGEQMGDLYLQAIVTRRDILSIRELTGDHLPLLLNIYEKCTKAIEEKYGVPAHKLRVYFHYIPSFYHLHVHFSALSFDAPGTWAGKAHILQDVLSNLRIDSDYYKKANLSFTLKDTHPLMLKIKEHRSSGV